MNETEWLNKVLATAKVFEWASAHFRPALTAHGWRTAVSGDGKGFPDLVLVHAEWGLTAFRELKTDKTKPDAAQRRWGELLVAGGADYEVWRPRDWPAVLAYLSGGRASDPVAAARAPAVATARARR